MPNQVKHKGNIHLLRYLLLITGIFFLWELRLATNVTNLAAFCEVSPMLFYIDGAHVPWAFWGQLVFFGCKLILLHLAWAVIIWLIAESAGAYLKFKANVIFKLGFLLWISSAIWLLCCNDFFYPLSQFSFLHGLLLPNWLLVTAYFVTTGIFGIFAAFAILYGINLSLHKNKIPKAAYAILLGVPIGIVIHNYDFFGPEFTPQSRPNVFIIGIDDLVPKHIHYFGYSKNLTPNLDEFLQSSTVFSDSVTPMARTFVAWSSILTGQYPINHGVRENFQNPWVLSWNKSLPSILQQQGYQTFFAMDDISFVNINTAFGFDKLVITGTNAANLVLATINDFPLSNLIVNTWLGKLLFPANYANRLDAESYDPDKFTAELKDVLHKRQNKPIFFAVHFCLTHWPFVWSDSYPLGTNKIILYDESIRRIDQQFADLMRYLRTMRLLDNAIVIVLSDHGEAFYSAEDRIIKENNYLPDKKQLLGVYKAINLFTGNKRKVDSTAGHGTDVLSMTQNNNLLAVRCYGSCHNAATNIRDTVSLVDIKPTILSLLGLPTGVNDGKTLAPYIFGKEHQEKSRMIFVESGISPTAIKAKSVDFANFILETKDLYTINPKTSELILTDGALKKIIVSKQRAVYFQDWILALYPDTPHMLPILVNRTTGKWVTDLTSSFARQSPAKQMLLALQQMYGKEIW